MIIFWVSFFTGAIIAVAVGWSLISYLAFFALLGAIAYPAYWGIKYRSVDDPGTKATGDMFLSAANQSLGLAAFYILAELAILPLMSVDMQQLIRLWAVLPVLVASHRLRLWYQHRIDETTHD